MALLQPGPFSPWLIMAGGAMLLPALIGLLRRTLRRAPKGPAMAHAVVIDGSNVMHWGGGEPSLEPLRAVIDLATERGWTPGVVFDANAGYKIIGRYQHDGDLARELALPEDRVFVVPKGTQADPVILQAARDMGARVISNDRFRDWAEQFPEVTTPGHLVTGSLTKGRLRLDLPSADRAGSP